MDGPREGHTEKGVRKRKTKVEYAFIYVAWRRMAQVTLFQSRNENSDIETKCMVPRGKELGWEELEYWD